MQAANLLAHLPQPTIPVITVPDEASVKPLIDALVKGGCQILEITLRTPAGLAAIQYARETYKDIIVGAGSVITTDDWQNSISAGAQFLVSPGASETLFKYYSQQLTNTQQASGSSVVWLPGVATASDMIRAIEHGLTHVKFFPAKTLGGLAALKSYASVFPQLKFCPTGGVNASEAAQWLLEPMIFAVGGSWFTPKELIEKSDWQALQIHVESFWDGF